jgi:hypothetical protein
MIQLNHGYRKRFTTEVAGIATAADSTPTAILYRNGSASGVTVTVSTTAETGVYLATFTTLDVGDSWAKTDHLELLVSATIDGDSGYKAVLCDSDGEVDAPMRGTDNANTTVPLDATQTQQAAAAAITAAVAADQIATPDDVSPSIDFAPEITVNPTELSSGSVDAIRDGLATSAKQDEILGAIDGIDCGGGGLTGDYTLTVTVTDADDSQPIENATVTLSRTGERGAELTDVNGVAVVGLDAATWSWVVRAAGYESRTGTVVISANGTLSVELDGIVQPEPPEPAEAPLCAVTLPVINQYGVRLSGVSVGFKFSGLQPNADPGAVIMSPPPPQVSDGNGVVQVNLIRLVRYTATYKIEGETRNIAIAVPDEGSFIVVDT